MIVTCPNCNCQFKVSLAVFGRDGRDVRCSACQHKWFQEPTLEDVAEELAEEVKKDLYEPEDVEDIAQAAGDVSTEEEFIRNTQDRVDVFELEQARMRAYYVAGALFFLIFAYLLMFSTSMMKANPAMQGFYKFLGMQLELPDTLSVTFEGVKAERFGTEVVASGRIVNLSRRKWLLPMIEVVVFRPVIGEDGNEREDIVAQWEEAPPEPNLGAEKEMPFSFSRHVSFGEKGDGDASHGEDVQNKHDDMIMVRVHFVVRPQTEEGIAEDVGHEEAVAQPNGHDDGGH